MRGGRGSLPIRRVAGVNDTISQGTFFARMWTTAENEYHVSPLVFAILYLGSFVPFYVGVYLALSGSKRHDGHRVLVGVVTNRLAWSLPYVYVLAAGRNLPVWVAVLVIAWPVVTVGWLVLKRDNAAYVAAWERRLARVVHFGNRMRGVSAS
jgi:hypothetical protein